MLRVENIKTAYGKIIALSGISLEVREGEIVTLIGANGAGKTTALKTIAGILKTQAGRIEFLGGDITRTPAHRIVQRGISLAPEGRRIFAELTVRENLEMGAFTRSASDARDEMAKVFSFFPILSERSSQRGGTLSGGEQQMLAIGRALMCNPRLLLLDEPSLGLAPKIVETIFDIISLINKSGAAILLVEQNANMALSVASRGYVLESGRIVLSDSAEALAKNETVKKAYLGG
jgi:branched-chain amino acid transport system ATP-binding protein